VGGASEQLTAPVAPQAEEAPAGAAGEPADAPAEEAADFQVPGLDQRVGELEYSAPTLDGEGRGRGSAPRGGRGPGAGGESANRAQRRAAAKRDQKDR